MNFQIGRIPEPNLLFGGNTATSDPIFGILQYGPYSSFEEGEVDFLTVRLGIIGSEECIEKLIDFLNGIIEPISPNNVTTGIFGFPGLGKDSPLRMQIRTPLGLQEPIPQDLLEAALSEPSIHGRLQRTFALYEQRILKLSAKEPRPMVVLCALPKEIFTKCKRPGMKIDRLIFRERKFKPKKRNWIFIDEKEEEIHYFGDYDFHNALKLVAMKANLPTQLIKYTTWEKGLIPIEDRPRSKVQDPVTVAWNFAVALYYKARGVPWKFTKLTDETLYAGIEFFQEISEEERVRASMARIFLDTGESFILRGEAFRWEPDQKKRERSPHLTSDQAEQLTQAILDQYYDHRNSYPNRVVIHKSSNFNSDELAGFRNKTRSIKACDFITIIDTPVRFYRDGKNPIVRGTVVSGKKDHYLFTTGYCPTLLKYVGKGVPEPLLIRPFYQSNSIKKICEEIMALTKLDWNTVSYNKRLPVTLSIADRVGEILSEPRAKELTEPAYEYRFYM
ncbi:MAG: hypothetical protein ACFFGZ_16800 [Candidatus Thorarchaeota archaeon]